MPVPESRRLLLAIIVLGLVARLSYVLWYPQEPVTLDAEGYDNTAIALESSGRYQASGRAPLYPIFLAAIYHTAGHSYRAVRVAQAVMVSMTALLAFFLARTLFGGSHGLIAASLVSFYPGFFAYSGLLLTETLFGLLLAFFTWAVIRARQRGGLGRAIWAGLVLGAAALCRFEIIVISLPTAGWLMWRRWSVRTMAESAAFVLAVALVVMPWAMRQATTSDPNVAFNGGVGATLWLSTYPGDWLEWYADREPLRSLIDCDCTARELDRRFIRAAIGNVIESPGQYVKMCAKRFGRFWIGSHSNVIRGLEPSLLQALRSRDVAVAGVKGFLLVVNVTLLMMAVAGMYMNRLNWEDWFPLALVIGVINLVHIVLFSTARYQIPVMPLVLVLAAPPVCRLMAASQRWRVS